MKSSLRQTLKKQRSLISEPRRQQAQQALLVNLLPRLDHYSLILSFCSLKDEINTEPLNEILAQQNRLLLPKIENDSLQIYRITNLKELIVGPYQLREPNPLLCPQAIPDIILVPALGFDDKYHRLGYGKGYYDKLLAQFPLTPKLGVGFLEQKVPTLPLQSHDVAMTDLFLC